MKLRATAQQQLWPSQLGLCWFDLEVLQLHGHAHVPRDLQLPLEERLNGRDGERAQIKKKKKLPGIQLDSSSRGGYKDCREDAPHRAAITSSLSRKMLILTRTITSVLSNHKKMKLKKKSN